MCGIAGIRSIEQPVDGATLERMGARLRHRGPDDIGWHLDDTLGLVQTRLAIIDVAGGHQPFRSADGALVLVANGEIYNFVELRAELESLGHRFQSRSDCEVILHAYAQYGLEAWSRLEGMFAFALYDGRSGRLVLGRDRLGIKPLFYVHSGQRCAFASEVKALLPALEQAPRPDPVALAQWLHAGTSDGSLLADVHQVPPGCTLVFDARLGVAEHRYWDLADVAPFTGTEGEARETFDALFESVMQQHVRSDVPYGLFLSGGIDSGSLAYMLSARQRAPLHSFSIGFRGESRRNELAAAQQISELFGTQHHRLELGPEDLEQRVLEAVWATDGLIQDPAVLPTLALAEEASRHLKVVFTGEGGDEAFGGYGRYRVDTLGRRLAAGVYRAGGGMYRTSPWRRDARTSCFGPALRQAWAARRGPVCSAWSASPGAWGHMRRRQCVDLRTAFTDGLLVKADRALMAHGLEGRVPFADHRIVEFGVSLPDELKIRDRHRKYFLRKWAADCLPEGHAWARKRGFHAPAGEVLQGALLEDLARTLPQSRAIREWFRPAGVRALIRRQARRGDVREPLWSLLQFTLWHRLFVDGREGAAPTSGTRIADVLAEA